MPIKNWVSKSMAISLTSVFRHCMLLWSEVSFYLAQLAWTEPNFVVSFSIFFPGLWKFHENQRIFFFHLLLCILTSFRRVNSNQKYVNWLAILLEQEFILQSRKFIQRFSLSVSSTLISLVSHRNFSRNFIFFVYKTQKYMINYYCMTFFFTLNLVFPDFQTVYYFFFKKLRFLPLDKEGIM